MASAGPLVLLQAFTRTATFAANQVLVRITDAHVLGTATLRLEAARDTSLFMTREAVRATAVRRREEFQSGVSSLVSLKYIISASILLNVLVHACLGTFAGDMYPFVLYLVSLVVELIAEPLYVATLVHWETMTGRRVGVEAMAVFARSIVTVYCVYAGVPQLSAYGYGFIVYAMCLAGGMYGVCGTRYNGGDGSRRLSPESRSLVLSLTRHNALKEALTESDKFAVARFSHAEASGGYAVAMNYGSLVPRIIFKPVEEATRLYFSSQKDNRDCVDVLTAVLLLYMYLGIALVLYIPPFVGPLVHLVFGKTWGDSSLVPVLQMYLRCLPVMAVNGLLESFYHSRASERWISYGNISLVVTTGVFIGATMLATMQPHFELCMVLVNALTLAVRALFAGVFVAKAVGIRMRPSLWALVCSALVAAAVRYVSMRWDTSVRSSVYVLCAGAALGIVWIGLVLAAEQRHLRRWMRHWKDKKE